MTGVPPWLGTPGVGLPAPEVAGGFVRAMRAPEVSPLAYPADMVFDRPNCGLVALAIASAMPLAHVETWHRNYGHPKGHGFKGNWKGRTWASRFSPFLNSRWIKHEHQKLARPMSVARFVSDKMRPGRLYVIYIRGHYIVAKDGWVCDQYANARVQSHKTKRAIVKQYWEIL